VVSRVPVIAASALRRSSPPHSLATPRHRHERQIRTPSHWICRRRPPPSHPSPTARELQSDSGVSRGGRSNGLRRGGAAACGWRSGSRRTGGAGTNCDAPMREGLRMLAARRRFFGSSCPCLSFHHKGYMQMKVGVLAVDSLRNQNLGRENVIPSRRFCKKCLVKCTNMRRFRIASSFVYDILQNTLY
jgi:hypothetical protein